MTPDLILQNLERLQYLVNLVLIKLVRISGFPLFS